MTTAVTTRIKTRPRWRAILAIPVGVILMLGAVTDGPARATVVERPAASVGDSENVRADFDGDGITDLAVGAPDEDLLVPDAGGVHVIYGSSSGLTSAGSQFWSQDSPGIFGDADEGDNFGRSLAAADFNGDGITDLAVGVPYEDFMASNAGGVHVIYGSSSGLTSADSQFWSQNNSGIFDDAEPDDQFGYSLAAADFGNGRYADLAVGTPLEDFNATDDGGVHVLYGSTTGITTTGSQFWSQDSAGIFGDAQLEDQFGLMLVAANVGDTSQADLVVAVPHEDFIEDRSGGVHVLYGSTAGITSAGSLFWSQNSPGIFGDPDWGDHFGLAVAAADLNGDGLADLAVGVPFENYTASDDGGVHVIYGSPAGLTSAGSQFWSQDSSGIFGEAEPGDLFGSSLAAADFGVSGHADLAVGVSQEDYADVDDGGVNVLYGSAGGLTSVGSQFWSQDSPGTVEDAEPDDQFGYSLAAANLGNSPHADLAVGIPYENLADEGAVQVIYGSAGGLVSVGSQVWTQNSPGISDDEEPLDRFGSVLTATAS